MTCLTLFYLFFLMNINCSSNIAPDKLANLNDAESVYIAAAAAAEVVK